MVARFVHIGDLHLGAGERNADRRAALDTIIGQGFQLDGLGAWLLPGDLNHGKMTIDDRNWLADRLSAMAAKAPVIIVKGNHDLEGDLDVFGRLEAQFRIVVVADQPRVIRVPLPTGDSAAMFCLPYPTEAGLVAAGVAPAAMNHTARQLLDLIAIEGAGELERFGRQFGDLTLTIGHFNVAGALASTGQPQIGQEIELDGAILARLWPLGYVGANHIHKAQQIHGCWYPGSVCRLDNGEVEPKGYLVVEYTRSEAGQWGYEVKPVLLDVPALYHVEGEIARSTFTYRVTRGPEGEVLDPPASWKGSDVRARVRFPQSEKGLLEGVKPEIFANFAECRKFTLELVAVPDRALRAPAVAEAVTLTQKLEAWAGVTGTAVSAQVRARADDLQHTDPERLVHDVRASVQELVSPAAPVQEVA